MIARLWKGFASADGATEYRTHVTTHVFDALSAMDGFLRGRAFQRRRAQEIEFLVLTEWESLESIRAFAGDPPDRAVVEPQAQACLTRFDTHVDHFELVGEVTAPAAESGSGARASRDAEHPPPPAGGDAGSCSLLDRGDMASRRTGQNAAKPRVIPMIAYENGCAALDWLARAFGFVEQTRVVRNGLLVHGEMDTGAGGLIMLATPTAAYQSPRRHREACEAAKAWSTVPWVIDGVLVYVDDIERHIEVARKAGAVLLSDLEKDPPAWRYRAEDLEGHRWMFMQYVAD